MKKMCLLLATESDDIRDTTTYLLLGFLQDSAELRRLSSARNGRSSGATTTPARRAEKRRRRYVVLIYTRRSLALRPSSHNRNRCVLTKKTTRGRDRDIIQLGYYVVRRQPSSFFFV